MKKLITTIRPISAITTLLFSALLISVNGCKKDFEDKSTGYVDDSRSNDYPGEPYQITVKKVEPGLKEFNFGIMADNHLDCSYGIRPWNNTDHAKRNRVTADDLNIDCGIHNCLGIVQIGDLVDAHNTQNLIAFRQIWENDYPGYHGGSIAGKPDNDYSVYSFGHKVKYPVFPTLGNHGIAKDDDWDQVSSYIDNRVGGAAGILENYTESRGTYCWRWGQYFFVQLGLWAGAPEWIHEYDPYPIDQGKLQWLEDVLKKHVGNSNMGVFIFHHYGWDDFSTDGRWWLTEQRNIELDVFCRRKNSSEPCNPYNIIGIFTGHDHKWVHIKVPAGVDAEGNKIYFNNFVMPDVGWDNNNQRGHAIVKLKEDKMIIDVKNRHTNTWNVYEYPINTGPPSPEPFWYVVGYDVQTDGHASSWGTVHDLNHNKPYGGGNPAGGGATVSDLNGNNVPELILMGINNLYLDNQFYYDVYWDVDNNGNPGTQKSRVYVPIEFHLGRETGGGGIAIADINENGVPDMLLMSVANKQGMNGFRYYIGWDINSSTGIPSTWDFHGCIVPGFDIGNETDGGGAGLYDIDDNGKLDLVLMVVTRNSGSNNFRYVIGWNIDPNNHGYPTTGPSGDAWSPLVHGPGNLGHDSQGGGLAISDLDKNGRPEFLFLDVDNPSGANGLRYEIAWNIDINGMPTIGGDCTQAPCWTLIHTSPKVGYENYGGGCALYDFDGDGKDELFITVLDEPFSYY